MNEKRNIIPSTFNSLLQPISLYLTKTNTTPKLQSYSKPLSLPHKLFLLLMDNVFYIPKTFPF